MTIKTDTVDTKKRVRRRSIFFPILNVLLIVAACIAVFIVGKVLYEDLNGTEGTFEDIKIEIPMGWNTTRIADLLVEEGIIENSTFFRLYTAVKYVKPGFNYGRFTVNSSMTYEEIIAVLQTPYIRKTVSVTFPEGTTALKMAMILADKGFFVDKEEFEADYETAYWKSINLFLEACNYEYSGVSFYDQIVEDDLKFCKLEGYLFPDTYQFYNDAYPEDVILKMLKNFENRVYTDENRLAIEASGYTLDEIVTMASIIQKESSGTAENYAMVSGVFFNRLNSSSFKYLESCTSSSHLSQGFIYGVLDYYYGRTYSDEHKVQRTHVPAGMVKAYNTYNQSPGGTQGIIIGAICNPGVLAFEGTINPAHHNYYFFCTDKSGTFYWAETYNQHVKNVQKAGLGGNSSSF